MHAYLIVGQNEEVNKNKAQELAEKLEAKILEFPLSKIEDVRNLSAFTKLKLSQPTALLLYSIEDATEEALNAFLKNLEEPQKNLYYILTAQSSKSVLSTIVSRCEVIKTVSSLPTQSGKQSAVCLRSQVNSQESENFLKMQIGEKFAHVQSIKERDIALGFVENLIYFLHEKLHSETNFSHTFKLLTEAVSTRNALKKNGNVSLQLINFIVKTASVTA